VKVQYWRGVWSIIGLKGAPALEFGAFVSGVPAFPRPTMTSVNVCGNEGSQ
jgi:hypothetical protein